jgi:WD40 repeat protein
LTFAADDAGGITQWSTPAILQAAKDTESSTSIIKLAVKLDTRSGGFPCTSLVILAGGHAVAAGFANGALRLFVCGASSTSGSGSYLAAEIAAHSRTITALCSHPTLPILASTGEDGVVNVWSLPELSATGVGRVNLDMTAHTPGALFTGLTFLPSDSMSSTLHLMATAYDSHALKIFLSL